MNTITTENSLGITFCERLPIAFTHGSGSRVWDESGKEYLDFTSGWGVTCLGHSHPAMVATISRQAGRLMQSPNAGFTYSPERAALLKLLQPLLPGDLSNLYFCNSGAEANDAVLKLARKITGKRRVISTRGSFHGRSFNTLSVTRGPENAARFIPALTDTDWVPYGNLEALVMALSQDTAAVIIEPVQGEGGVQIPDDAYLSGVQTACKNTGTLLILDEVKTGFCRTGKFFAAQHSATPLYLDMMTMAKGIAGGFPFAAFAVSKDVNSRLAKDDHGGTYYGNPMGCALSHTVIRFLLENRIARKVEENGKFLLTSLQALQLSFPGEIQAIRGKGLLCAIELTKPEWASRLTHYCAELGLLVVPTRNAIVRLLPDLLVSEADLQRSLQLLSEGLAVLKRNS